MLTNRVLILGLCCFGASACAAPAGSTAPPHSCNVLVVTGYWPPSNEMLRQWSQNHNQNPEGWQGANWEGLGYDLFSFFPEFPPDGDPTNNAIGEPGSVGDISGDLPVDYQQTSRDFWRIMDQYQPRLLVTTSRGGDIGWELEAVEGGHGRAELGQSAAADWVSDRFGEHHLPQQASIDARSWDAIATYRLGRRLRSQLPLQAIATASRSLAVTDVAIDSDTSGNYLSGFMGLHGLYYHQTSDRNLAAGHIHVGKTVSTAAATALIETTLRSLIAAHPPKRC